MNEASLSPAGPGALPVTVVIVNYQTPDLTSAAVASLRRFYPFLPLILIDNGSADNSIAVLRSIRATALDHTLLLENPDNRHHGPAMNQGARMAETPFVLFFDSDCAMLRGGVIEALLEAIGADDRLYAVGKRIFMNDRGFDVDEQPGAHPYIRPICMLVRTRYYRELPPFERHGAPCLANMRAAVARGWRLGDVPVEDFVHHAGRGTASRHGYRLGLRGKWNHLLNRLGL